MCAPPSSPLSFLSLISHTPPPSIDLTEVLNSRETLPPLSYSFENPRPIEHTRTTVSLRFASNRVALHRDASPSERTKRRGAIGGEKKKRCHRRCRARRSASATVEAPLVPHWNGPISTGLLEFFVWDIHLIDARAEGRNKGWKMVEEGLAARARARVSAKGCIGAGEERRGEWEKWREREREKGGRSRERIGMGWGMREREALHYRN